ncbi:cysteine-rich protein 3 isoform X1 [Tachysurus vachellii]|uniref:cysteine-rich protein 3 isoform X1 n=1 Tax=Tachysurus vachellii TaxID=175792 RepID=UPI00296B5830|nr:cysteine-rich protein 3 isoform X1 [Tachysurus vachellii]
MTSNCPRCEKPVFFAEKVSSLGKNWHRFCLKCERCNKILSSGGHAEHEGLPYCHKPCYGTLFGPKGVNIGGAGSYVYDTPSQTPCDGYSEVSPTTPWSNTHIEHHQPKVLADAVHMFSGETSLCPGCSKVVYFAERVMSLGRNWHRPCLRCERCKKTLTSGGHAEHEGRPYCHVPCYGYLFGPKGVNIGEVGCYVYEQGENGENKILG